MASGDLAMAIQEKRSLLDTYERRIDALKVIISDIDNKFDDDVKDINERIEKCKEELEEGLKGCGVTQTVNTNMEMRKMKYSENDLQLSSARESFSQEIQCCQTEVSFLECEIRSLESLLKSQEESQ